MAITGDPRRQCNRQTRRYGAIKTNTRTNEEISSREVRLIDENGEQLGIVPIDVALERARAKTLDLVEVAPDAAPPVCRIMDFTRHIFEQRRKQKLAKKKAVRTETKEIKLRPNIDPHDFEIKLKHAREFLEKGHKVKITLRYRPREMRHYEIGTQVLHRLTEALADLALVEAENRGTENMRMQTILLTRKKTTAPAKKSQPGEAPVSSNE
ncbi:MAG: translation initiation factor IF-3 [bacterium]|nr:translation initiation factor IF-3 [bacterium]